MHYIISITTQIDSNELAQPGKEKKNTIKIVKSLLAFGRSWNCWHKMSAKWVLTTQRAKNWETQTVMRIIRKQGQKKHQPVSPWDKSNTAVVLLILVIMKVIWMPPCNVWQITDTLSRQTSLTHTPGRLRATYTDSQSILTQILFISSGHRKTKQKTRKTMLHGLS